MPSGLDRDLRLPPSLRGRLGSPITPVVDIPTALPEHLKGALIIAVGDVVVGNLLERGIVPHVAVVDGKTRRSEEFHVEWRWKRLRVSNPPGTITRALSIAILEALNSEGPVLIEVEGEEDLAAIPAIYLAPEGAIVIYGIPDRGAALVNVDSEIKGLVKEVLDQMEVLTDGVGDNQQA